MANRGKVSYELKLQDPCGSKSSGSRRTPTIIGLVVLGAVGVAFLIAGIVLIHRAVRVSCTPDKLSSHSNACSYSAEARQASLPRLLDKIKEAYFEHNPNFVAWKPDLIGKELTEYVRDRYFPYDPSPSKLKAKTDAAKSLLDEINKLNVNEDLLKPRESKALAQATHFLKHTFGVPYDENYYAGDWMLGPNYFCWQPLCYLDYDINSYGKHAKPRSYGDVLHVIDTINNHRHIFKRYRQNMELGVKSGMVRSITDCKSSVYAFKDRYRRVAVSNESSAVLDEFYAKVFTNPSFLANLELGVEQKWEAKEGMNITESLKQALVKGFADPLLEFVTFLEFQHVRHCPPDSVASGLGDLPLQYVWLDGKPNKSRPTTKKLLSGEPLDGKETYRMIMSYFTTTDITPEQVYEEGLQQLRIFMPQVIAIAKQISGQRNETEAITAFQKRLNARDQWHNNATFPENESNAEAYRKCNNPQTARLHCPKRWEAVQKWADYIMSLMGMIDPKITPMFYYTGSKTTAGNCPIEMQPHYNPSNGAMYFDPSDSTCSRPSYFGLPFFLKEYGPKFQEWSVTGHEARPGHHTQLQGYSEHLQDRCGGIPEWLDNSTSYVAFQEGWALYGENPILSHDVNLYRENTLQKYGMLKWMVWRAVRLVVDTGLHYRGMKRSEALEHFANYTWDTTDFAVKEVTRYQSDPGQATAYMLGRLEIMKLRNRTERELGNNFILRDFHYQVLSQGSSPITYLRAHIDRYIRCAKGKLQGEICDIILKKTVDVPRQVQGNLEGEEVQIVREQRAPRSRLRHYV